MKLLRLIALPAGLLCGSCTEHVYPHQNTTVWQSSTPASRPAAAPAAAPAAHVTPYTPETVEAVRAE